MGARRRDGFLEQFTPRACEVIALAQEEARPRTFVASQDILLGLIREEISLSARVLESLDVTIERARAAIDAVAASSEEGRPHRGSLTDPAQALLERAPSVAQSLEQKYVGG